MALRRKGSTPFEVMGQAARKEEADRLNSMLSAYTDDTTVAAGLYKDLGADGTVASRLDDARRKLAG